MALAPFEWKDEPSLIEHLFPVQKLSAESYKEQMAGSGKTLTVLGSYWKGRKPLVLNKACILASLLPATDDHLKDLEIFEMLMGMDGQSMQKRIEPALPVSKRDTIGEYLVLPFNEQVRMAKRAEEIDDSLYSHIWSSVNDHLGTSATSIPELVKEMGIARFGRRPRVADVFCGSGQIPFEAARLGCDVYASDLNPIASLLTWGAFNVVGASKVRSDKILEAQNTLVEQVQKKIDELDIENDGEGWTAKAFLYCFEVKCPQTGWIVPLLPSFVVSQPRTGVKNNVCVELIPNPKEKRYDIEVIQWVEEKDMDKYRTGTVQSGELVHSPDGKTIYRVKISSIRGDYTEGREIRNELRLWEKTDFTPRPDDIFQERLYCIQWIRPRKKGRGDEYEFRSVTQADLEREQKVIDYVGRHLAEWQDKGYIPDMVIESGEKTDEPIRTRGWTHWHHLFNPRQLLVAGLVNEQIDEDTVFGLCQMLNWNSRLCVWNIASGGGGSIQNTFYNQALNTLFNYGCRGSRLALSQVHISWRETRLLESLSIEVATHPAQDLEVDNDLYVTDPPYGDAVKYEEITEFFIAWLRKNPPEEFAHWVWDSRRSIAIKGEDEGFRRGMIASYRKMAEKMPDNGIQIMMFTHQSGAIWADMANIIWASGLQVTAAWYVVTETDSALRRGANVTGTVILVLRKRHQELETFRDDLGWEIEEAVKEQIDSLIGLDERVRAQGSEGMYTDADLQMAGYAAALKVLTAYSRIDGKDMVTEAESPRQKERKTLVDELIEFAVQTAVQFLIPIGFDKNDWQKLQAVERFYLKMVDMEYQGAKTLDNYQNFAKAFRVRHFDQLMSDSSRANSARLKLSSEFKGSMMSGDSEIAGTPLRALLYALFELDKGIEVEEVLLHLMDNCPNYMPNKALLTKMADYLAEKRDGLKETKTFKPGQEASYARILAEALRNQRL